MLRHRLICACAIIALLVSGAACSSGASGPGDPTPTSTSALMPPGEGASEYPRTIKTWFGETELTQRPERIAVIGSTSVYDSVAALGVVPVYSYTHPPNDNMGWWDPAQRAKIDKVEHSKVELDAETVGAMEPDLIITLNYWFKDESIPQKLMDIAPVLDYEVKPGDKEDWRLGQRLVGDALDLRGAADKAIADADAALAKVAADNPAWAGKTVTFANDYGAEYGVEYLSVAGGYAEQFFLDLGFAPNPLAKEFTTETKVSEERMDLLNGDILIMGYNGGDREKREAMATFAALPPVRAGRYVNDIDFSTGSLWVLRAGASALSLPWLAEVVSKEWLADIDLSD